MSLREEIFEQPAVLKGLTVDRCDSFLSLAEELGRPQGIFIAARGSSDNAARYAKYIWGGINKIPVTLAAPSLFSVYHQPPMLSGMLVVGISQSGESPDLLAVLQEGNRQGCRTLAITNQPNSPLAMEADYLIDILAGPELAVAATKSYTGQLAAIAMLAAAWAKDHKCLGELAAVPQLIQHALELDPLIQEYAPRYRYMDQCVILGRGYNYSTAYEWSLKLKELAYVVAQPYSTADFQHGPIALVSNGFPVFAVAPSGEVYLELAELISELKGQHKADIFLITDQKELIEKADCPLLLPKGIPEWLSPLISIVPAQLFSYHLTVVKGYDPDAPRGLSKVTLTR
jgi:glucosamine--fructose-6-phosphate aminotransferase (isomerizing)